jgi:hypothetical protein
MANGEWRMASGGWRIEGAVGDEASGGQGPLTAGPDSATAHQNRKFRPAEKKYELLKSAVAFFAAASMV